MEARHYAHDTQEASSRQPYTPESDYWIYGVLQAKEPGDLSLRALLESPNRFYTGRHLGLKVQIQVNVVILFRTMGYFDSFYDTCYFWRAVARIMRWNESDCKRIAHHYLRGRIEATSNNVKAPKSDAISTDKLICSLIERYRYITVEIKSRGAYPVTKAREDYIRTTREDWERFLRDQIDKVLKSSGRILPRPPKQADWLSPDKQGGRSRSQSPNKATRAPDRARSPLRPATANVDTHSSDGNSTIREPIPRLSQDVPIVLPPNGRWIRSAFVPQPHEGPAVAPSMVTRTASPSRTAMPHRPCDPKKTPTATASGSEDVYGISGRSPDDMCEGNTSRPGTYSASSIPISFYLNPTAQERKQSPGSDLVSVVKNSMVHERGERSRDQRPGFVLSGSSDISQHVDMNRGKKTEDKPSSDEHANHDDHNDRVARLMNNTIVELENLASAVNITPEMRVAYTLAMDLQLLALQKLKGAKKGD